VFDFYDTRNATITGNRIIGNVAGAVVFGRSIDATFANNKVVGDPRNTTNGLDVEAGSRNIKFANNVVRGYNQGFAVDETIETTIEGNDVIDSTLLGIGAADSPGTEIRSNVVVSRSGGTGILLVGQKSQDAKVVGNNISGGAEGIFLTDTHGGSILGNTVRDNCAGMLFEAFEPVGGFEVKGNNVEDNTRSCRGAQFGRAFSGIGIALLGASGMEVTGNHLSGNVPSGPTRISGGVVVAVDPYFGGTTKPKNNSVTGNTFGRNKPDIFWDGSGTGNRFVGNNCDKSVPTRLCN
jgi:parallel beta-helix repeat protein